ncbi:hypothetical protein HZG65_25995 [Klebsiella pneumoniae]|nr:hypothetical protein [Klebsiella pneumoniae]
MTENQIKELTLKLVKAESEEDLEKILKEYKLWDSSHWKYFGGRENNYSTIGNQQSDAIAALIEKVVNAGDAILIKECLKRGIVPKDEDKAPKSTKQALKEFFNIDDGDICRLTKEELRTMASDNILLVATSKDNKIKNYKPCISIIDNGEGQYPNTMENTFLSIGETNKLSIPFVQGKFNMGGTGVLQFCGSRKFQLILTKRHSDIDNDSKNEFKDYWGITIVRKQDPKEGQKSSAYTYLAPHGEILRFKSEELIIKPDIESSQKCKPYMKPMKCGTFIKLYDYDMKSYSSKKITMTSGLTDGLNMMLAKAAVPVRLIECRDSAGRTNQSTVSGYEVRLLSTGKVEENIEENFPVKSSLKVDGQDLEITIYAFKKDKEKNYKKSDSSIVFTLNGQTQGFLSDSLFTKKKVGLEYIKKSIFVIVDCTNMDTPSLEELFMNSRDRLRDSRFADKIKEELEDIISENYALKELRDKRRKEELESKVENNKLLADNLKNLIKGNPNLQNIFNLGLDILESDTNTVEDKDDVDNKEIDNRNEFEGKEYPTYFKLKTKIKDGIIEKSLSKTFKIKIETDVKNGFFDRKDNKYRFVIKKDGEEINNYKYNLDRGIIDVSIGIDKSTKVNDLEKYSFEVISFNDKNFGEKFEILFKEKEKKIRGNMNIPKKPKIKEKTNKTGLALPNIISVTEEELESKEMKIDSALRIIRGAENDFLINVDNKYIKEYTKKEKDNVKKENMINQYKWAIVLYGISMLSNFEKNSKSDDSNYFNEIVENSSKAFAQMFFPIQELTRKLDFTN